MMTWLGMDGVESVSVTDVPHSVTSSSNRGFYGVRKIEMYELGIGDGPIGHSPGVRTASSRKWEVIEPNGSFPIGNVWDPPARRVQNRFTHEHLVEMTGRFGLRRFDRDFYAPEGVGLMLERTDPVQSYQRTFTLAQARGEEPVDV